jgi:hypothetical protein
MPQPKTKDQCPQCWKKKRWPLDFIGRRGKPVRWCQSCQDKYRAWGTKTPAEKAATPRRGVPALPELRARLFRRSGNKKLGGIPSSITSRGTCPPSCGFYEAGCYAESHVLAAHWRRVGERGDSWQEFIRDIWTLPEGQLWRHNEAGDLPGDADRIDRSRMAELVDANRDLRGFTYTHKHADLGANRALLRHANRQGFTVNLSADSLEEADRLVGLEAGPVVAVVSRETPDRGTYTPAGWKVVVCPAQTAAALTCAQCELCAHPHRLSIIGFRAHGQAAARVDDLVQLRRSASG